MTTDGRRNVRDRGRWIAQRMRIVRQGPVWLVPSSSSSAVYSVDMQAAPPRCTCPAWEVPRYCKHVAAVEITIAGVPEIAPTPPAAPAPEGPTARRPTYRQDWPAYNRAQTEEKDRVARLLRALCEGIRPPPQPPRRGHPRLPLSDCIYAAVMKVYGTMSGRRSASDLRAYEAQGYIDAAPHYNTVFRYLADPALTPVLKALIEDSAAPLRAVESDFSVDGSGFSTCNYVRWYDVKYGREMKGRHWVKAHIMCGVRTNIVTSLTVTDGDANDSPQFIPLLTSTVSRFNVKEVSADKAYANHENTSAVLAAGADVYIPFKSNTTGEGPEFWRRLYHFYEFNRSEFLAKYHKRSNIESTMWMIKSKFGAALRSKTFPAMVNELHCKVLAHNLCVLVQSFFELGIEPRFNATISPTENQWLI